VGPKNLDIPCSDIESVPKASMTSPVWPTCPMLSSAGASDSSRSSVCIKSSWRSGWISVECLAWRAANASSSWRIRPLSFAMRRCRCSVAAKTNLTFVNQPRYIGWKMNAYRVPCPVARLPVWLNKISTNKCASRNWHTIWTQSWTASSLLIALWVGLESIKRSGHTYLARLARNLLVAFYLEPSPKRVSEPGKPRAIVRVPTTLGTANLDISQ